MNDHSTATQPTVGRIVHYVSYGTPGGEYGQECRAAIVTHVDTEAIDPRFVSLCVVNPTGLFFREMVSQDQGGYAAPGQPGAPTAPLYRGGTWHFPERVGE